jgi:positive regulator of sigma E activity
VNINIQKGIILKEKNKFMKCQNCQANVGCGCNLKNGLCKYCQAQLNKPGNSTNNQITKNVNT